MQFNQTTLLVNVLTNFSNGIQYDRSVNGALKVYWRCIGYQYQYNTHCITKKLLVTGPVLVSLYHPRNQPLL
jgi:hypothetical protein